MSKVVVKRAGLVIERKKFSEVEAGQLFRFVGSRTPSGYCHRKPVFMRTSNASASRDSIFLEVQSGATWDNYTWWKNEPVLVFKGTVVIK